ncbi:hypothetical protein TNCV_1186291 [Trichonephila clavipes]|nr:hypothetical protein TNCV_1186291 [Trichonephila clavipes]
MAGNVFVRGQVTLFTRAFKEADLHYCTHLSCHLQQTSNLYGTMADTHLIYQLAEVNAQTAERLYRAQDHQMLIIIHLTIYVNRNHYEVICTMNVGHAFQQVTVSNTFCSMNGTKYGGYLSKESKYYNES